MAPAIRTSNAAPSGALAASMAAAAMIADTPVATHLTGDVTYADGDSAPLPAGTRVGDYILNEAIATGGFGTVYRAEHALFGTEAAVKVLHPELALTQEAVVRFEREVQAIRRIDHPNVIRILDFGELEGGRPYFAMELLKGLDLESYLRSCGRLSPDEALSILEPVCSALVAAHDNSIIHRDFKASNVFLAEQCGRRRVVLLDFGVAKLLDDAGPGITTSSHILGTPACMAPEQITAQATDARTDVYALGALTYYMLTGELPFVDSSLVALLHMHLYARPPSPSREAPVSPVFDEVVLRAMAKEPSARYQTVREFLADFRAAVHESEGVYTPWTPRHSLVQRLVSAIYVEVVADEGALEEPDERLLADMEEILPYAAHVMEQNGFEMAVQTGNTMLMVKDLGDTFSSHVSPSSPAVAAMSRATPGGLSSALAATAAPAAERRAAVSAALELDRALQNREGRDARVHVNVCLHAGYVFTVASKVVGGELLDLAAWVPQVMTDGVVGTNAILTGLELNAEPVEGAPGLSKIG